MCVSEEYGLGEGEGVNVTLLTDARRRVVRLSENVGRIPGVKL